MKTKNLTKAQKNKVDKIDTLLTQLRNEGVFPFLLCGAGNPGLSFIRANEDDLWDIGDVLISPSSNDKAYDEIMDKLYQAPDAEYNNQIEVLGV